jgi:hypothetical protein
MQWLGHGKAHFISFCANSTSQVTFSFGFFFFIPELPFWLECFIYLVVDSLLGGRREVLFGQRHVCKCEGAGQGG